MWACVRRKILMRSSQMGDRVKSRCASCRQRLNHRASQVYQQCNYQFYGVFLMYIFIYLIPFVQVFRTMSFHRPSHPTVELEACLVESTLRSYGDGFMCDSASAAPLLNSLDTNVHCCRGTDFSVTKKLHPIFHMHGRLRCQNEHFISARNTSSVHGTLHRCMEHFISACFSAATHSRKYAV